MNNLLIQRTDDVPAITGVLDAGFAQWGDPIADWTIMRLTIPAIKEAEPFWESYGPLDDSVEAQVRLLVYQARSVGFSILELHRMQHPDEKRLWNKLTELVDRLQLSA